MLGLQLLNDLLVLLHLLVNLLPEIGVIVIRLAHPLHDLVSLRLDVRNALLQRIEGDLHLFV